MNPVPYAQTQQQPLTNWYLELYRIKIEDGDRLRYLKDLAMEWPSCACGMADAEILRYDGGEQDIYSGYTPRLAKKGCPKDHDLRVLGGIFGTAVLTMWEINCEPDPDCEWRFEYYRKQAIDAFLKIEKRANEIIRKQRRSK